MPTDTHDANMESAISGLMSLNSSQDTFDALIAEGVSEDEANHVLRAATQFLGLDIWRGSDT